MGELLHAIAHLLGEFISRLFNRLTRKKDFTTKHLIGLVAGIMIIMILIVVVFLIMATESLEKI